MDVTLLHLEIRLLADVRPRGMLDVSTRGAVGPAAIASFSITTSVRAMGGLPANYTNTDYSAILQRDSATTSYRPRVLRPPPLRTRHRTRLASSSRFGQREFYFGGMAGGG